MAYSATVTGPTITIHGGRKYYRYTVAETQAASGSEFTLDGLPPIATVVHYHARLTAGTGTTILPTLGNVAAWTASTVSSFGDIAAAAAAYHDTGSGIIVEPIAGKLYVRSTPNDATADHTIASVIVFAEGAL